MPGHARPAARVLRIASNRPPYLWIMFQHTHNPVQTGPASAPSSQEFGRRWIQAKAQETLERHRGRRSRRREIFIAFFGALLGVIFAVVIDPVGLRQHLPQWLIFFD